MMLRRRHTVIGATFLSAVLGVGLGVGLGVSAGLVTAPAQAAPVAAAGPPALGTDLGYHRVGWHGTAADPDGDFAGVSVSVPRAWRFVLTRRGRDGSPTRPAPDC